MYTQTELDACDFQNIYDDILTYAYNMFDLFVTLMSLVLCFNNCFHSHKIRQIPKSSNTLILFIAANVKDHLFGFSVQPKSKLCNFGQRFSDRLIGGMPKINPTGMGKHESQ